MRPSVIIIADASYCPETGAGGYAFRIEAKGEVYFKSGQLKKLMPTNGAAELAAVVNAMFFCKKYNLFTEGCLVHVKTDCKGVISRLSAKIMQPCTLSEQAAEMFSDIVSCHKVSVELIHIKAHQNHAEAGKDGVTHNRCDRLARKAMRLKREALLRGSK